jgi:hypothetical protein
VAVVLQTDGAVRAVFLQARAGLRTDTDTGALLDVLYVLAYFDGFADDFVADDACYTDLTSVFPTWSGVL